jgi:hypothetical protein
MALARDGLGHNITTGGASITCTLTTTQANDYIIVSIAANKGPVVSVSGSSLGSFTRIGQTHDGGFQLYSETWAKFSSAALTSEVITITQTGSDYLIANAFGVSGSNQTSLVWDANTPTTAGGSGMTLFNYTPASSTNTMVIASLVSQGGANTNPAAGWTDIESNDYLADSYRITASTSTVTASLDSGGTTFNRAIGIGIPEAASGPPTGTLNATEAPDAAVITGSVPIDFQFLGVGSVVETATTSHTLSLTGIAARQPGDLLVACIGSRTTSTTSVTLPSGWTLVNEQKTNNALTTTSAIASGVMAYHVRGASDPALTFTHPAGISVARGAIVAYRPISTVSLDTSSAATTTINTTSVNVAGLTTATATELLVYQAVGGQEATWTNFDAVTDPTTTSGSGSAQTADPIPGAWQERSDTNTMTGNDMSLAVADAIRATAGATGNFTATASLGAGHVIIVGAFKLAVAPVTGTLGATEAVDTASIQINPVIPANPVFAPGHALLTNMLACYLPGVYGGAPVQGIGPTLANGAGGAGTVVTTVEGAASRSNTLGSAKGLIATAPSAFKTWTNFTVLWRGLLIGTGDNFCPVVGVSIGDTDVSPYFMLNVSSGASSHADEKSFYGDATASETTASFDATSLYGKVVDFVATATVGGNVTFYANGVSIGTGSLTTISTSSSTSKIVVNQGIDTTSRSPNASVTMAAFWDRALSSTEVANLHSDPYGMLQSGVYGALGATEAADAAAISGAVGTSDWTYLGVGDVVETTATSHTLSLTGIAARQPGDLLVACLSYRSSGTTSVTLPSGWTLVGEQKVNNNFSGTLAIASALMAYAIRGASDPALTFTHPTTPFPALGAILAYRPSIPATLDVAAASTTATNTTSVAVAGLTTTQANDLLVYLAAGGQASSWTNFDAVTDPATDSGSGSAQTADPIVGTWQERTDTSTTTSQDASLAVADAEKATAGATGNFTATSSLGAGQAIIVGAFKFAGVSGTLGAAEAPDAAALTGTVSGVVGALATIEAPDVAAFTGAVGWNAVLAATEAADTAIINGTVVNSGTLAATEAPDVAAFTGAVRWTATLAAAEAPDTALINGGIYGTGTLAATEAPDVAAFTGAVRWNATLAATEAPDTALISGGIYGTGTLAATEAKDVADFAGSVFTAGTVAGSLNATEAPDVAAFTGSVTGVAGILTATEAPDIAAFTGTLRWNATLAATEAPDVAAFTGALRWNAILAATEAPDTAAFFGNVAAVGAISGILAAIEASDIALFTGTVPVVPIEPVEPPPGLASINEAPGAPGVLEFGRRVTISRW